MIVGIVVLGLVRLILGRIVIVHRWTLRCLGLRGCVAAGLQLFVAKNVQTGLLHIALAEHLRDLDNDVDAVLLCVLVVDRALAPLLGADVHGSGDGWLPCRLAAIEPPLDDHGRALRCSAPEEDDRRGLAGRP